LDEVLELGVEMEGASLPIAEKMVLKGKPGARRCGQWCHVA
jgi:hypothetical protein